VGPLGLLKDTEINHMAKLMFKWAYFNLLLKGVWLGPPDLMMEGKQRVR
jgi:sulfide:quinone oxidoreductase